MRRNSSNQVQRNNRDVVVNAPARLLRETVPLFVFFTQQMLLCPQLRSTLERNTVISILSPVGAATVRFSMKNPGALMSFALLVLMGQFPLVLEKTTTGCAVLQVPAADISRLLGALGVMPRPQAGLMTARSDVQAAPQQPRM